MKPFTSSFGYIPNFLRFEFSCDSAFLRTHPAPRLDLCCSLGYVMISDSMTSGLSLPVPLYAQSLCQGCRFKLHPLAQHSQSVCAGSVRYAIYSPVMGAPGALFVWTITATIPAQRIVVLDKGEPVRVPQEPSVMLDAKKVLTKSD